MSKFHFQPIKGQTRTILSAVLKSPEISSCSLKEILLLRLACEEIITNVVKYAYPEGADGFMDIEIQKADSIIISFEDGGMPFNPLEQKNPDTTLSWKKRPIGGLGILLTIRKMDDIRYSYINNKNVLTIEKVIRDNNQ